MDPPPGSLFPALPPAGHALLRLVDSCRSPSHLRALRAAHARLLFLLLGRLPSHPASAAVRVKLIQAYAACAALPAARAVLDASTDRTTVFFNVLLRGLTAASLHRDALLLFASMRPRGPDCFPDHYTYPLALKSCAATNVIVLGMQIHSSAARLGLDGNAFVAHSAISMYARCGRPGDAYQVFGEMRCRDVVSWNAMISGFAHAGLFGRALDVFRELVALQCPKPDAGTLASVLPAMGKARLEDIALLRGVFDEMQFKGLISWNAMLAIYTNNEMHVEAVELFMRMQRDGIEPDAVTLATVLPSCGEVSALSLGKRIHEIIKRKGMCSSMLLENALMDMYSSCGCLKEARDVFDSMGVRDVVSWTSIISAYGRHGHGRDAIDLFEKMHGQGLEPDSIAFVAILAACSQAGCSGAGHAVGLGRCNAGFECVTVVISVRALGQGSEDTWHFTSATKDGEKGMVMRIDGAISIVGTMEMEMNFTEGPELAYRRMVWLPAITNIIGQERSLTRSGFSPTPVMIALSKFFYTLTAHHYSCFVFRCHGISSIEKTCMSYSPKRFLIAGGNPYKKFACKFLQNLQNNKLHSLVL
uniref:Pentatricopeptide repeat-containing protein n=1 Tax=Leersia perrieri TaxID=77586 RepID=A0A0D9VRR8_9ORYZ